MNVPNKHPAFRLKLFQIAVITDKQSNEDDVEAEIIKNVKAERKKYLQSD